MVSWMWEIYLLPKWASPTILLWIEMASSTRKFLINLWIKVNPGLSCSSDGKESACNAGDPGFIPGAGRSPGEGNGNPSSILAWRIPWTEEPGGLQSRGSQTVGHDWAANTTTTANLWTVYLYHLPTLSHSSVTPRGRAPHFVSSYRQVASLE